MARVERERSRWAWCFVRAWLAAVGAAGVGLGRRGAAMIEARPVFVLREVMRANSSTRVRIELKAQGLYRPGPGAGRGHGRGPDAQAAGARRPDAAGFQRTDRAHRPGRHDSLGRRRQRKASPDRPAAGSLKVARHVVQAASAINGEVRPMAASLRPEVALLVAEKRDRGWPVVVFSPAGPLSWSELELVQAVGDPLALADLLPDEAVGVGDHWKVRDARGESGERLRYAHRQQPRGHPRIGRRQQGPDPPQGADRGDGLRRNGGDRLRGIRDLRPSGGPNRPRRLEPRGNAPAGAGRGRARPEEHPHGRSGSGRAFRTSLGCRARECSPGT